MENLQNGCDWMLQFTIKGLDENGREVMWNIRGRTVEEFDANLASKGKNINKLRPLYVASARNGAAPAVAATPGQTPAPAPDHVNPPAQVAPLCAIHHVPMNQRNGKRGETFWSCNKRLEDGTWCPYRPPKG